MISRFLFWGIQIFFISFFLNLGTYVYSLDFYESITFTEKKIALLYSFLSPTNDVKDKDRKKRCGNVTLRNHRLIYPLG